MSTLSASSVKIATSIENAEAGKFVEVSASAPEDWQFTKDRPQFADDGRIYRQQRLAPDFKRSRTVRVDEDDHDLIIG